ncbi:TPA: hypothetical protein ACK3Q6_005680 [Burkholderia cepacia]|uniref:hypothetical protein n=1 Tax=Burkholderia cepacia TaxID=292 RepID=UPI001CF19448|nr:hypothetical protein [Burkholderia cepacia]MCA8357104.1 hypothetical protein [Burkholderia cepacia]HDR9756170.1 hypothetical protein [Burkholderia cepacia ATCC 25416]HDV6366456.1 hypothetical protein [Burkholderia cepacia]
MMRLTFIRVAAALAVAASGGSLAHEPVGQPRIVDVFPAQSWVSLGAEDAPPGTPDSVEPPAAEPPALSDPIDAAAAPPMPFEIAGEWRTQGQRIVVLEGDGKTFLLCGRRCGVRDAVLPGGEIADGYRLKTLGETGPVVMTRNGSDIELSPPSPTH